MNDEAARAATGSDRRYEHVEDLSDHRWALDPCAVGGEPMCSLGGAPAHVAVLERVRREGVESLSDCEVVELVAGPGWGIELDGDPIWSRWSVDEWRHRGAPHESAGCLDGLESAARLAAAFEIGRRTESARRQVGESRPIDGPLRALEWFAPHFRGERQECFAALLLDGRHRVQRLVTLSRGTLTTSLVHPREVFGPAIREGAAAILVAHNHPSGDPEPSAEDLAVTERLVRAGELLGIQLVDHLVMAGTSYRSLRRISAAWGSVGHQTPASGADEK